MKVKANYHRCVVNVELTKEELEKLREEYLNDNGDYEMRRLLSYITEAILKGESHGEL